MSHLFLYKIKNNSGESIAETLVAVLIAAFALLMLAGTVNTSTNLITRIQNKLEAYYKADNSINSFLNNSSDASLLNNSSDAIADGVSFEQCKVLLKPALKPASGNGVEGDSSQSWNVMLYKNSVFDKAVFAYCENKTSTG